MKIRRSSWYSKAESVPVGGTKGTGNGNIVNEVKEIDFGKHIIKGENGKKQLLPNTKYVTNDNYKYKIINIRRTIKLCSY